MNSAHTRQYQSWLHDWGFTCMVTTLCAAATFLFAQHRLDERLPGESGAADVTQQATPAGNLTPTGAVKTSPATSAATAPKATPGTGDERLSFHIVLTFAVISTLMWATFAFTGDPFDRRTEGVKFTYFFVAASFAIFATPPLMKSQAVGTEPIGIISGCVNALTAPEQLRCFAPGAQGQDGPAKVHKNNQWLVNIGGALTAQNTPPKEGCVNLANCKLGSPANRAEITGGLVVPLPFIILALFGGAISLSRRVPEIQKCSEPGYVGTATEPQLQPGEVRERLIFQIVQFVSAPMIAIVAYQVIRPESDASSAGLAFMSGFGSETILLMVRGVVDGIKPRNATPAAPTGAVSGVVTGPAGAAANVMVSVLGSTIKTTTDQDGRYLLPDVPAGARQLIVVIGQDQETVAVSVIADGLVNCDITLSPPPVLPRLGTSEPNPT